MDHNSCEVLKSPRNQIYIQVSAVEMQLSFWVPKSVLA